MTHSIELDVVRVQAPHSRRGLSAHGGSAGVSRAVKERLEGIDLSPPGLPPQAVLVIRRLADPLPGQFDSAQPDSAWERAVKARLDLVYRRAARPALGSVPADAEAVLFADPGEMLACLALDARLGLAHQRWWWKTLLRRPGGLTLAGHDWPGSEDLKTLAPAGASSDLAMLLETQAFEVPAVVARLAQNGLAAGALSAVSNAQAWRILQAVLRAYHLPELPPPPGEPPALPLPFKDLEVAISGLGRAHTALLGVSLALHTRPWLARSPAFQSRLRQWWLAAQPAPAAPRTGLQPGAAAGTRAEQLPDSPKDKPATRKPSNLYQQPPGDPLTGAPGNHPATSAAPAQETPVPQPGPAAPPPAAHSLLAPVLGQDDPAHVTLTGSDPLTRQTPPMQNASGTQAVEAALSPETVFLSAAQDTPWAIQGIPTRLGGLLYLVNLMLALDLPNCFEYGWRLSSGVGAWGLLEALGRELLGDSLSQYENDHMWSLLAELDGRDPGSLPGARLPRSRPRRLPSFNLPPGWTKGLPQAAPDPLPRYQCASLRHTYRPLLAGWLVRALPWIMQRLAQSIPASEAADPRFGFLRLPARVYSAGAHLDLAASVEDIDLGARLSGLDRDPGWQPDFGRAIYFHFE